MSVLRGLTFPEEQAQTLRVFFSTEETETDVTVRTRVQTKHREDYGKGLKSSLPVGRFTERTDGAIYGTEKRILRIFPSAPVFFEKSI